MIATLGGGGSGIGWHHRRRGRRTPLPPPPLRPRAPPGPPPAARPPARQSRDRPAPGAPPRRAAARPRRAARELLRVLRPGGTLVLAAPAPRSLLAQVLRLAQGGPGALPDGIPSPAAWGREEVARRRIAAVAPGTAVEVRTHQLT